MTKQASFESLVEAASQAETIAFGGGGLVRKPMAAAAALGLSSVGPRAVCSLLGGPEVDLLIGLGKISQLHFAYVGFDALGLAPNFRSVRQAGGIDVVESSEYLILAGLEAAARRVPFLPTHSGLGTDLLTRPNAPYRTFRCPITDQTLVAAPALAPDLAVIHVNVADRRGNALIYGEVFGDFLLARAARRVWLTADNVVDELPPIDARPNGTYIPRLFVEGVVPAPGGAAFTGVYPDHPIDFDQAETYCKYASDPVWLRDYAERVLCNCEKPLSR